LDFGGLLLGSDFPWDIKKPLNIVEMIEADECLWIVDGTAECPINN